MINIYFFLVFIPLFTIVNVDHLEVKETKQSKFVSKYINEAKEVEQQTGIPYYIILSQSAYESGWGTSNLARDANNLFGIRWYSNVCTDFHIVDGGKKEWRCYDNTRQSFIDYGEFMLKNTTIPDYPKEDYKKWCEWIRRTCYSGCGNYRYERNIRNIIENHIL